ncbi:MAG TPA: HAD family hydrolase [Alphaproteobacteria bacterium]|nr:HAD family hydrolase [Alphaproteobacteria bacterium]
MDAVIFDVDGTLIDSVDLHTLAWQDALRHFGIDAPYDVVRHEIGKGGDQLLPVFLSKEDLDRRGHEIEQWRGRHYKERYMAEVKAFPEVRALFERLRADGKRIALASSAKGDELEHYLKLTGIGDLIEASTSKDDAERSKPEPDIFQAALDRLGIAADRAVVVGDTPWDAIAAARAGLPTIGMLCGGFEPAELEEAGCIALYQSPADLLQRYDDSPIAAKGPRL